jgi:4-hydroxybenzoyl-CoA thioesterase
MHRAATEPSPPPPERAFTVTRPIRFSHSDPAGIVYYPNYFDMMNGVVEDWFGHELGIDFATMIMGRRHGLPIVHAECDFRRPSRFGERLDLTLLVAKLGRTSLAYRIVGHVGGEARLEGKIVTVMIALDTGEKVPIPDALRRPIELYQGKTATP